MTRAVLWDFDGTLAHRSAGMWSACLASALDVVAPGHGATVEALRPGLRSRFPWHTPSVGHSHADADAWWAALGPVLAGACAGAGVTVSSGEVAAAVRERYTDPACWTVYDDVVPALERLAAFRHVILSNHVPELPSLVAALGLAPHFSAVVTSAAVGWEKPHPAMFAAGLAAAGSPDEAWMVGDNAVADVAGAEAAGLRAVLVRSGVGLEAAAGLILGDGPPP